MSLSASIQIDYNTSDGVGGDGVGGAGELSLALDAAKNTAVYGQSKTTFAPGETAYLRVISPSETAYTTDTSMGTISAGATDVPYSYEENLSFLNSKTATLAYLPYNTVTHSWIGVSGGTPTFSERVVSISTSAVAILHCEYQMLGDRLKLVVTAADMGLFESVDVIVVVTVGDSQASVTVPYSITEGSTEPIGIDLEVSDFCSDEIVAGVSVTLDGEVLGVTNENGKINLGELVPKTIHTLKMTKTGYKDSDKDVLYNDSFTVPVS